MALNARVRLHGSNGERTLAVADLFAEPTEDRRTETVIAPDELLLDVRLPAPTAGTRSTYRKAMDRKVWAFALVGVAAVVRMDGTAVADARIVLTGVAPIPRRAQAAERVLIGQAATPERITEAAETAVAGAQPLEHNGYTVRLARNLVRQALTDLTA